MTDLADRIEREGPSRELDAEIAPLIGLRVIGPEHPFAAFGGCVDGQGHGVPLPAFTSSLDAAMTLVPEGHNWSVQFSEITEGEAWIFPPDNDQLIQFYATASTPAAALSAAAIRARISDGR